MSLREDVLQGFSAAAECIEKLRAMVDTLRKQNQDLQDDLRTTQEALWALHQRVDALERGQKELVFRSEP